MLRPFTSISIQQMPTQKWSSRTNLLNLDFVTEYEIESTWEKHTDTCKITFPKNIVLKTNDALLKESGTYNVILGGSSFDEFPNISTDGDAIPIAPLIMKGDIVTINHGYWFRNKNGVDVQIGTNSFITSSGEVDSTSENTAGTKPVFFGYVSQVHSDTPIVINCDDNFYLLKRTPFDKNSWTGNLYSLMQHIISLVNAQFNSTNSLYPKLTFTEIPNVITAKFSLGYLDIGDMTCGQLLDKLKSQFHFESTFVGNTLVFGAIVYNDSITAPSSLIPNSNNFFSFRDVYDPNGNLITSANIFPSHDLEYKNKDDVILSTIVQCKIINPVAGKTTKDGFQVTKKTKLKVLVYWDIPTETFKYIDLSTPGSVTPKNPDGGERHDCKYPIDYSQPAPDVQDLFNLGVLQLTKYYYTGFTGCFTTFGFPFVYWNDNVNILDPIMADRNGQYKVKMVKTKGGIKGLSQEIHLDYKQQVDISKLSTNSIFMM